MDSGIGLTRAVLFATVVYPAFVQFVHAEEAKKPTSYQATMEVDQYYTDNVFYSRPLYNQRRVSDWVTLIKPALNYNFVFGKGSLGLGGSATIGRYATQTTENFEDFEVHANGRYKFDPLTSATWGLGVSREHEPRSLPDTADQMSTNPTQYWKAGAFGAISRRIGDNTLKLGVTYDGYNFDNGSTAVAPFTINNDDRDRDMTTIGARFTHPLTPTTKLFVDSMVDWRKYRQSQDDNGYERSSLGGRSALGFQHQLTDKARVEVYGGALYQDFRDPRFDTVFTADFGANYIWRSNGASVQAGLERSLEETTLSGVSSYIDTTASVRFSQDLDNSIRVYAGLSLSNQDFQNSSRSDAVTNFWLGVRKYMTPYLYIGGEAGFEERDSSDPTQDYTAAKIMARVGVDSNSGFDPEKAASVTKSGFYVGSGGSVDHVGTMLDGQRQGASGSVTSDFGNLGVGGRVLAGWGMDIEDTYLGVEADLGISGAGWDHQRAPGGRAFSVHQSDDFGFSVLAGQRLSGGTLVYGRAGIRSAAFETDYATAKTSASSDDRRTGFEYGIGVRTPIDNHLALSLEYVRTRYNDYSAAAGNATPDAFANVTGSTRFALTYAFGGIPKADEAHKPPADFSGAYWGVQAGLGTLGSLAKGNRQSEGTPPVTSIVTADRGDDGYALGGLVGYNLQRGRFVVGAEMDAEFAHEEWNQQRQPSGRTFSLSRDATFGLSARAGYVLGGGALLYGRVGTAISQFNNSFSTPGYSLSQTTWHGGLRYGGGIEVPLSQSARMRFDYSVADYGTFSLATPSGVETYDTKEQLFRVGYIRNF